MPRKSLRRRRRRSSKKSKKTFTKQLTKRSKSKKIRGGVTTRNGVRRGNYRFLSTLKAQDLTRLNPDIIGEIREMHPLLTTKLNNITLRHAVKDYLSSYVKDKRFIILKYGEIGDWDVSNVTNMTQLFEGARSFNQPLNNWNVSNVTNMKFMFLDATSFNQPLNNWNVSNVTKNGDEATSEQGLSAQTQGTLQGIRENSHCATRNDPAENAGDVMTRR